jgi:phosphoglycolate phosphatase
VYVGDSLPRDIAMAKQAGVTAAWARYGTQYERRQWQVVVRVSHWTADDIKRETTLQRRSEHVAPDYTLARFSDLLTLAGLSLRRRAVARRRVRR